MFPFYIILQPSIEDRCTFFADDSINKSLLRKQDKYIWQFAFYCALAKDNAVDLRLARLPKSVNRLKLQFIYFDYSVTIGADA